LITRGALKAIVGGLETLNTVSSKVILDEEGHELARVMAASRLHPLASVVQGQVLAAVEVLAFTLMESQPEAVGQVAIGPILQSWGFITQMLCADCAGFGSLAKTLRLPNTNIDKARTMKTLRILLDITLLLICCISSQHP
jgi:hypothetical protein